MKPYLHEVLQEVKARKTISKIGNHIPITESLYNILPLSIQSLIPLWFVETRTLASRSLYFADGKYCSIFESNFLQLMYNLLFLSSCLSISLKYLGIESFGWLVEEDR